MISHRHRCIYVKVPKCASTSLLEAGATARLLRLPALCRAVRPLALRRGPG